MKKFHDWTVNCTSIEEKNIRYNDFIDVWIFMSKIYTGDCLRDYQHQYLEEKRMRLQQREIPMSAVLGLKSRVPSR
jgi:hypothetical protein